MNIFAFDNQKNKQLFFAVLAAKIVLGVFFCAYPMRNWFIPFVEYFINSGFRNPWEHFLMLGEIKAFPYGPVMLVSAAIPFLLLYPLKLFGINSVFVATFAFTSIVLVYDFVIYRLLRRAFPNSERKVLLLYWCSPIVIYINYYHHQLDVIPVAFLMLSLFLLFDKKIIFSAFVLGLGLATKLNLLIAVPFILFYLFRSASDRRFTPAYAGTAAGTYILCILPFVFNSAFQKMVLRAPEQTWVFDMLIPFGAQGLSFLIGPFFLFLVLLNFASYEQMNTGILVMFIGLVFMLLVTFIAPMPGWYIWSFPFIVYAFLKYNDFPRLPIYMVTAGYLIYFSLHSGSTFFDSWSLIAPQLSSFSANSALAAFLNLKPATLDSILFIPLVGSMFYLSILMFTLGARSNQLYSFRRRPYFIGIGGDSASGKHTLASFLKQIFGEKELTQINSDDYHIWERGHPMYKVYTHLDPRANDLSLQFVDASLLRSGRVVDKVKYEHTSGTFTARHPVKPGLFVAFVGLHPFYFPGMRKIFDFKIFLDPDEQVRREWKIKRDAEERGYAREQVLESLIRRLPDYQHFIKPQRRFAELVIAYAFAKDKKGRYRVSYEFRDQYEVESIVSHFQGSEGLFLEYKEDSNCARQRIMAEGKVSPGQLEAFVDKHRSEYENLLNGNIRWLEGVDGFTQLMVLHLFSQKIVQQL